MPRISVARGNKRVNQWFATELKVCSRQSFKTLFPSAWLRSSSVIFANVTSRTWKRTRYWQRGQNCVSTVEIWWPRQTRDDRSKKHKESNRDGGAERHLFWLLARHRESQTWFEREIGFVGLAAAVSVSIAAQISPAFNFLAFDSRRYRELFFHR